MPTYEYRCAKCGEHVEEWQSFSDVPLTKHDDCGGKLQRVLSPAGIVLKGSGFYKTDNRSSSSKRSSSSDHGSGSKSDSGVQGRLVRGLVGVVGFLRLVELQVVGLVGVGLLRLLGEADVRRQVRIGRRPWPTRRSVSSAVPVSTRSSTTSNPSKWTRPMARPSGPISIGTVGDHRVAFVPRHGPRHTIAPARIPQRANLWAMRTLGVRSVIGPCAVGSLRADVGPGDFVILDQLVDRTRGRDDTFYDGEYVHHVSFADPYCPVLRAHALAAATDVGVTTHAAGTIVVINGPRFSTRAESRWYRAQGWDVVGMTQYPEAYLARELGMHYAGIALVTDYDTGVEDDPGIEPVTMARVLEVMEDNVGRVARAPPRAAAEPAGRPDGVRLRASARPPPRRLTANAQPAFNCEQRATASSAR